MLDTDVMEPAQTEWASPLVFIPEKDQTLRLFPRLPQIERSENPVSVQYITHGRTYQIAGRRDDILSARRQYCVLASEACRVTPS